jgi:hypothetical protein
MVSNIENHQQTHTIRIVFDIALFLLFLLSTGGAGFPAGVAPAGDGDGVGKRRRGGWERCGLL